MKLIDIVNLIWNILFIIETIFLWSRFNDLINITNKKNLIILICIIILGICGVIRIIYTQ